MISHLTVLLLRFYQNTTMKTHSGDTHDLTYSLNILSEWFSLVFACRSIKADLLVLSTPQIAANGYQYAFVAAGTHSLGHTHDCYHYRIRKETATIGTIWISPPH